MYTQLYISPNTVKCQHYHTPNTFKKKFKTPKEWRVSNDPQNAVFRLLMLVTLKSSWEGYLKAIDMLGPSGPAFQICSFR